MLLDCLPGWVEREWLVNRLSDDVTIADFSTLKDKVLERAILALQIYRYTDLQTGCV
jgi:hypothetical protein